MAVEDEQLDAAPEGAEKPPRDAGDEAPSAGPPPWRQLWHVPTVLLSIVLIGAGIHLARQEKPGHDFDGALDQVEELVASKELQLAAGILEDGIAPHLNEATELQNGRFHAISADILSISMDEEAEWDPEHLRSVISRYDRAESHGFSLETQRLERSANALLRLGVVNKVTRRIEDLEILMVSQDDPSEARAARNRVLRRLIVHILATDDLAFEEAIGLLNDFAGDPLIEPQDELWAVERFAELRLSRDRPREAIDHLTLEMRRLEGRGDFQPEDFGSLYVQMAHAYADLGEFEFASAQVAHAMTLIPPNHPERAHALVMHGRVLAAKSQFDAARDAYDAAARDFPDGPWYATALFGRAEMSGVLGDHEQSQEDFRSVADVLNGSNPPTRPRREDVVTALAEQRHDAALATLHLERALEYIELALRFYKPADMPEPALRRLASTNRAIAESILAEARQSPTGPLAFHRIDIDARRRAASHFKAAADYFVQRAAALANIPTAEREWGGSVWLAADSYDHGGYYDLAIERFAEYIANRTSSDPRWLEGKYRLARAHQATFEFSLAATLYEEVIESNAQSLWAMQSHVPLASCYVELGRHGSAQQQLLQVVEGRTPLQPEAIEYRDALIALGSLYFEQGEYRRAIEELAKAEGYYGDDPEASTVVRFRLGESLRLHARAIDTRLEQEAMAEGEAQALRELRQEEFDSAESRFRMVIDDLAARRETELDEFQRETLRLSRFAIADCAFELGAYDRAIDLYDRAAQQYSTHPASLVALIQIVNAYTALGDGTRARTAHQRALLRLEELPASAFEDMETLFDGDAWRRWLESLPPGVAVSSAEAGDRP